MSFAEGLFENRSDEINMVLTLRLSFLGSLSGPEIQATGRTEFEEKVDYFCRLLFFFPSCRFHHFRSGESKKEVV